MTKMSGIEDVDNQRESPGYPIDIPTPHKLGQSITLPHPVHDLDRADGVGGGQIDAGVLIVVARK